MGSVTIPSETFQKMINTLAGLPYGQIMELMAEIQQVASVDEPDLEETKED